MDPIAFPKLAWIQNRMSSYIHGYKEVQLPKTPVVKSIVENVYSMTREIMSKYIQRDVTPGVAKVNDYRLCHLVFATDISQLNSEFSWNHVRNAYQRGKDGIVTIESMATSFLSYFNQATIPVCDGTTIWTAVEAAHNKYHIRTIDSVLTQTKFRIRMSTLQLNLQWSHFRIFQDRRLLNYNEYFFSQYIKNIISLKDTIVDFRLSCNYQDNIGCILSSHSFLEHFYNEIEMTKCCYFDNKVMFSCQERDKTESKNANTSNTLFANESNRSICCKYQETQIKPKPRYEGTDSKSSNDVSRDINMETVYEIMNHEHLLNKNEQETDSHKVSAAQSSLSNENIDTVFPYTPSSHNHVIDNEFKDVRVGNTSTTEQTIDICQTTDDNITQGTEDTVPSGHLYSLTINGENISYGARTELVSLVLPSKLTDAYSYARKPSTVLLQNEVPSAGAEYNVLDLKQKVRRKRRNYPKLVEINKAFKYKYKHDEELNCRDSYVEDLRNVTWLPLDMLPVPKVEIDVRRIEFEPLNTIIEQLARDENPGPHITMRYELLRFCTLRNYPRHDKPYLIRIAGAGFYYAAEGDELVCYCCGMRKSGWTESDKPMEIHTRLSPRCSFLLRNEDVNVRVQEGRSETDRFAFLNEPSSAQNTDEETTESNSSSSTIERMSSSEINNETQEDYMSTAGSQEFSHPIVNHSSFMSERPQRRPGNFSYSSNTSTAEANNKTPQEDNMSPAVSQEFNRPIVSSSSATTERHQRRYGNFSYSSNNSTPEVNNETPQEDYMSPAVSQEFNRPIVSYSSATPARGQRSHGNFSYSSNSSTAIATTTSHTTSATTREAGNINPQPKHPNYAPRSVRVASFQGWPDDLTQTPEVLADAGFYYAGIADCVRCYFCGLGLRHWSEEDNPWIEHARWSRPCLYVKMIKGEEFINLVHLAVQYTENERGQNEDQHTTTAASGDTNTEHTGNQIPIDEINRLLLTDAAQSVLDMGYQPDMIKKAIEKVLIRDGRAGVSSTNIMAMIFEIEEEDVEAALTNRVSNIEISSNDNRSANGNTVAASSTALGNGTASTNTATINNDARHRNLPISSSVPTNQNTVAARSTATGTATSSNDTASANSITTNSMTGNQQSKTNTNKKDAKTVKKENERMKMQTMCQICKNNSVAIVFLPCGHLVTCETCAPTLRNCPMQNCNTIVKGTVKAFMA